jgi:formamidopyrimidine-DNA glycosylase
MPELPEVEATRSRIEQTALGRRIVAVDDSDRYVCRPHAAGEIRRALVGRRLTAAHRQGKAMWCDTSGLGRLRTPGPVLGIHLGISGGLIIAPPGAAAETDASLSRYERAARDGHLVRFALTFDDGTTLRLVDPRRLARVRLDPPIDTVGPDAQSMTMAQFTAAIRRGSTSIKARLLDQTALSGVGNILADQTLWSARVNPLTSVRDLSEPDVRRLARALRMAIRAALAGGGVEALAIVPHRRPGGRCPRCRGPMRNAHVAGRSTWWCAREQP